MKKYWARSLPATAIQFMTLYYPERGEPKQMIYSNTMVTQSLAMWS